MSEMTWKLIACAALGVVACEATSVKIEGDDTNDTTEDTDADTDTDTDTEDTDSDTDTDTLPLPEFDCSTMPAMPAAAVNLEAPRGYNDLVFDSFGAMIGSDENVFWSATGADAATVYAAQIGMVYKMGILPGGDVVAARSAGQGGGVIRVDPAGGTTVLAPGLHGYGLAVGSDGQVYLGTNYTGGAEAIIRIDPDTGDAEQIVDCSNFPARAIAFNRDYSRLYFGTLNGGGVYGIDMDANLDPVGLPVRIRDVPDSWHDTLEVDACGQIYVGSVFSSSIFRINMDMTVTEIIDWNFNSYGHGFDWGGGVGDWDEMTIYVTHPYIGSRVDAFYLGVPSAQWEGTVIGGVTL